MADTDAQPTVRTWEALYGPNVGYALDLYDRYLDDPESVDPDTRAVFESLPRNGDDATVLAGLVRHSSPTLNGKSNGNGAAAPAVSSAPPQAPSRPPVQPAPTSAQPTPVTAGGVDVTTVVVAARLARGIREYGHLAANIDPLGAPRPGDPMLDPATHGISEADLDALPATIVWPSAGPNAGTCRDAIQQLREIYCGSIGYEFDHVQDFTERTWLHEAVESGLFRAPLPAEKRRALLWRLSQVEGFEKFLDTSFKGQKRFSIEGTDMLVPMLDEIVEESAAGPIREILIGMAHRGRLNVLAHVLRKPYAAIFAEFHHNIASDEGAHTQNPGAEEGWTGDVKYHLGAQRSVPSSTGELCITLADNPSHLEVVNPVVAGFGRAAQDDRTQPGPPRQDTNAALPVTIHGDAAFPGEGVVSETLNLSRLPGYNTGGTIRIIVNNQIGFTTSADDGRSTLYAGDLAKGFEVPIVHVNADDPDACLSVVRFAYAYRERFGKDFLIDLVGYRRWGHNEGDEPTFTQPRLYATIAAHPTVRALYAERLTADGVATADEAKSMADEVREVLRAARDQEPPEMSPDDSFPVIEGPPRIPTGVDVECLRDLNIALLARPDGFTINPKLDRVLSRRATALDGEGRIDWATAENLALASILADGTPIRFSGQDTERGTFSHRHLVLHDPSTGAEYIPLQSIPQAKASFAIYNSPLTETAVLGFEYGYSVHAPEAMVMWEAQFGDFANTGQVIVDQFLSASRAKWRRRPSLVMLLPHGYEGQGPEHSSARLERYLQLAAEGNMRIANCTTAAQYFHLLRMHAALLESSPRPLVVMTPKSLLRHPLAASSIGDITTGRFQAVLDDRGAKDRKDQVERLILCSGKVAVDLTTTARNRPEPIAWVAVARLEMLYPFPEEELRRVVAGYPNLREVVWLQEEPRNMGAATHVLPRIAEILPDDPSGSIRLRYMGRPERASTAEGSQDFHGAEQARIVEAAFEGDRRPHIETRGVQYVD